MNVVGDATHFEENSAFASDDSADVGIEIVLKVGCDERAAFFRAEDEMIVQARVGGCHIRRFIFELPSPLRGEAKYWLLASGGVAPGYLTSSLRDEDKT